MLKLDDLLHAIPLAWNPGTSGKPEGAHPSEHQALVSALLIQRHCGGRVLKCEVGGEWGRTMHWINELDSGARIDVAAGQFMKRSPHRKFAILKEIITQDVIDRVDILERRVEEALSWR